MTDTKGRTDRRTPEPTTEFLQGFLGVGLPVAALPDVAGLQLHRGPHRRQRAAARLQVHLGKQLLAARPRLIVHSLVPTWGREETGCCCRRHVQRFLSVRLFV